MKCAQIIGVTVSETTVDTTMAKVSVSENSRSSRPTIPSMKISGVKAAISDRLIDSTVKPICLAPSSAAASGAMPCSRLRYMFSIITMASSTTKPTEIASAISDRLSIEKPASHIPAQVPASASGTETPAAIVGVSRRRNANTTTMTRNAVASSVYCMSSTLARMVPVRSTSVEISTPPGSHCFNSGSSALTRSTVSMTLASPCLVIWISTAGCLLNQAIERLLRTESSTSATSERRTKLPAEALDDDVAEFGRGAHLLVGRDRLALAAAIEDADRAERIGVDDREPDVVGRDPGVRERDRVERDPHRGLVRAADGDFADARHLRDALRDHGIGDVVHRARGQRLRGQRQHEHRRRRRIGFAEPRQRRQVARQIRQRGVDRGLHVARGAVDVAADRELQLDAGGAERTGRGDLVDAGDLAEPPLQWRRNRRCHDRGVGARARGGNPDRRKIDIGNRRHRQEDVGDDPDQKEPDRQQRGAHRPADEGLRDRCHYCIPSVAPATGGPAGPGSGTAFSILRLSRSSAR